jgi:glycerate-2-kinase
MSEEPMDSPRTPPPQTVPEAGPQPVERPWIQKQRRVVADQRRTVWRARAKIGTQPGTIALFFGEPVEGEAREVVEETVRSDVRWARPFRVTIDRIDDTTDIVRCSLR